MSALAPLLGNGTPALPVAGAVALLMIDMQNAYCHPDGVFACNAADPLVCQKVVEPCARLMRAARAAGIPVLHAAKVSFSPTAQTVSFHNTRREGRGMLLLGDWDADFAEGVRPAPGEVVLHKPAFSAFFGTALDSVLLALGARQLVLAGVTTSICLETTARDAAQRALDVFVVRDASAEWEPARHERSIEQMSYAFARVVTVEQLTALWSTTTARR